MKNIIKILLFLSLLFGILCTSNAGIPGLEESGKEIQKISISVDTNGGSITKNIENTGIEILKTIKIIFGGVLVIYMVYAGIQMVLSLGTNEEDLKKAKTSIWYAGIALVFINIPGTLYNAFSKNQYGTIDGGTSYNSFARTPSSSDSNFFIDTFSFGQTLTKDIIGFLEVSISAFAIAIIIIAGLRIIFAGGKDDEISKQKTKIVWAIGGLLFIGFIESWKYFIFEGDIGYGAENIFAVGSNLALFFAGPIATFFLALAGYYYITSNGDEEKVKKAKNIVFNTLIATVILLAAYTFLLDLNDLLN